LGGELFPLPVLAIMLTISAFFSPPTFKSSDLAICLSSTTALDSKIERSNVSATYASCIEEEASAVAVRNPSQRMNRWGSFIPVAL